MKIREHPASSRFANNRNPEMGRARQTGGEPRPASSAAIEESPSQDGTCCVQCGGKLRVLLRDLVDTRYGVKGSYEVRQCAVCGLGQTFPVPSPAELKNLYQVHYNFGGERGTVYTRLRERFFASLLYRLWMRLDGDISFHRRRGSGRLLDVGCNEGRGLEIYARNGFEVEGLELNEIAAAVAGERGFVVHVELLERFRPAVPYEVILLSNVLEHSLSPKNMLLDIHRLLAPQGQVWISCPNRRSWLGAVLGRSWINWHVPFHTFHFSRENLERLLADSGFDRIEIRQITPALWVALSVIACLFSREGEPTRQLRSPLLVPLLISVARTILFPALWLGNRLGRGDCLVATARKL